MSKKLDRFTLTCKAFHSKERCSFMLNTQATFSFNYFMSPRKNTCLLVTAGC